jgi:hypothetical protein
MAVKQLEDRRKQGQDKGRRRSRLAWSRSRSRSLHTQEKSNPSGKAEQGRVWAVRRAGAGMGGEREPADTPDLTRASPCPPTLATCATPCTSDSGQKQAKSATCARLDGWNTQSTLRHASKLLHKMAVRYARLQRQLTTAAARARLRTTTAAGNAPPPTSLSPALCCWRWTRPGQIAAPRLLPAHTTHP